MANTQRVDKKLFSDAHYLGKPADDADKIISRRIAILEEHPDFFNKEMDCIEVGCGSGVTITRIAGRFRNCVGIDIFDYAADFEEQKNKSGAVNCHFEKLDLENNIPDEKYDRLISFEVIEHLKSDDSVQAYHEILHPGALAAITVPNKWWVFETHGAKLPLLPWNRVPFFSWLPSFIHERYANARIYTKGRIMRLMVKHGFEIIDHCYVTAPMDVLKEGWLKRKLVKYVFRNDKTAIPFLSTSIFILARKKATEQ